MQIGKMAQFKKEKQRKSVDFEQKGFKATPNLIK